MAIGAEIIKSEMTPPEMICPEKCCSPSARLSSVMLIETDTVSCPLLKMIGSALARVSPEKSACALMYNQQNTWNLLAKAYIMHALIVKPILLTIKGNNEKGMFF